MKTLLRHALDALAALSLLACIAAAGVWVRSWGYLDGCVWMRVVSEAEFRTAGVVTSEGRVLVLTQWVYGQDPSRSEMPGPDEAGIHWFHRKSGAAIARMYNRTCSHWVMGVGWDDDHYSETRPAATPATSIKIIRVVSIPGAYAFALTAVLPGVWLVRTLARRRRLARRPGFCAGCGYDLRASPGRCPECGRPAAATGPEPQVAPGPAAPGLAAPAPASSVTTP
jgi:hypothetical protein